MNATTLVAREVKLSYVPRIHISAVSYLLQAGTKGRRHRTDQQQGIAGIVIINDRPFILEPGPGPVGTLSTELSVISFPPIRLSAWTSPMPIKRKKKEPHRGSDPQQRKIPSIHLRALILYVIVADPELCSRIING